jgi:hypothetical protein
MQGGKKLLLWLNFVLQLSCSAHCPLVRQRLYTLVHYTGKRESTIDSNGILQCKALFFLLTTIMGTLVTRKLTVRQEIELV